MNFLSLETSSPLSSICCVMKGEVIANYEWQRLQRGESLVTTLQWMLEQQGLTPNDFDFFAVGIGPGSFTGLRTSMNAIKSLGMGTNKPITVLSSHEILALQIPPTEKTLWIAQNAFGGKLFISTYLRVKSQWKLKKNPYVHDLSEPFKTQSAPLLIAGDGQALLSEKISLRQRKYFSFLADFRYPRSKDHAQWILTQSKVQFLTWEKLNPLYLRASSAEENLKI